MDRLIAASAVALLGTGGGVAIIIFRDAVARWNEGNVRRQGPLGAEIAKRGTPASYIRVGVVWIVIGVIASFLAISWLIP